MFLFKKRRSADQKLMDRIREPRMDRIRVEGRDERGSHLNVKATQEVDSGGREMIKVTRLSGEVLYLNILQIESMESIPETKIKMMNGYYYLVKDTAESLVEQLRAFYHSCLVPGGE